MTQCSFPPASAPAWHEQKKFRLQGFAMSITEVTKPERLVFSHGGGREGAPSAAFVATWIFDGIDSAQTKVTIRMVFPTAADRDNVVREYGAIEGAKQTLERLAEHLPKMA
ncbi:MAG: SRPBCC domain-containing protein [Limisphaerales bacterium]